MACSKLTIGFAIFFLAIGGSQSLAEDAREDQGTFIARVQLVEDSSRLYYRGLRMRDAPMMAIAAEMRAEGLGLWRIEGNVKNGLPSPADMLEMAKAVAEGDQLAIMSVDRIEGRRKRGSVNGPLVKHGSVTPGDIHRLSATFDTAFPAVVYVESEPGRRFILSVVSDGNATICRDDRIGHRKLCRFLPAGGGQYEFLIQSQETTVTEFLLITN